MDLLEQPDIKKTYEKCKYIVKLWEHKFVRKYKRLPSKLDIREANSEVRHAYRKYFQLKTAALEQSFIDVDGFDDDQEDNGKVEEDNATVQEDNAKVQEDNAKLQEDSDKVQENVEAESNEHNKNNSIANSSELDNTMLKEDAHISNDIWGPHLNKKINENKPNLKNVETIKNANVNISKKLFCGSKFTKRNPRKSLSFSQKSKSDVSMESQISLSQPLPTTAAFGSFASEEAINLSEEDIIQCRNNSFQMVTPSERVLSQPVNIIQSVLENNYQHSLKTVDTGWLQRVVHKVGTTIDNPELPKSSPFLCNTTLKERSLKQTRNVQTTKVDYDSEDIIDDSDDETSTKDIFHISKKIKIDELPALSKIENNFNISKPLPQEVAEKEDKTIQIEESSKRIVDKVEDGLKSENNEVSTACAIDETLEENMKSEVTSKGTRRKQNSKATKLIRRKKSKTGNSKKNAVVENKDIEISPRRSSRKSKVKVNLQEFSSEEEDAFHTDTDEKDPEFNLDSSKPKRFENIFQKEKLIKTPKKKFENIKSSTATPKSTIRSNKKVKIKEETADEDENIDDNKPYELEFSVKPRIVAPRCNSIKKILTKNLAIEKAKTVDILEKHAVEDNSTVKDKTQQAKERLEKKVASGNLNDNYVLVNLKKKIFVRGKSGKSFSKYKKAQWKSKKAKALSGPEMDMGGCDGGMLTCFNCGQIGHFARNCKSLKGDGLLPLSSNQEEDCPYPTLEEASQMAKSSVLSIRIPKMIIQDNSTLKIAQNEKSAELDSDGVEDHDLKVKEIADAGDNDMETDFDDDIDTEQLLLEAIKLEEHVKKLDVQLYIDTVKVVKPYFELNLDGSTIATPAEVYEALQKFGHSSFRSGQEQAVMRILSGKSTLVTLSTGSGKSLCYQLPAYLYSQREPCISLVISPLVSLMDDQVTGIPKFMKAACLHSNQTKAQRQKILQAISMGELSILLISPEAVVAGEKQIGFGSLLRKLPPIAFACIDEAHCVSQWSHNFRPSYLMICRVLRESLGVKTILGLTATATRATRDSIINHLQIPDGHEGVISDIPLPDNLILTASKDPLRDHALIGLLMSDRFVDCKSIIIYCTRRDECERIASFLRTSLKHEKVVEETNKKRKRVHLQAEPYHAGLAASRRRTIQNRFMSGELRIVVATVAFGMGINKSDIRAVIHYNMPNSFESYVQEVGRAGRDGLMAQCHVFMDSQGRDENELRRHIHANSIDRHVIRKLLQKVFIPCSCKGQCPKHEVAFSIEETVRALDIPEENISTLLCYLELHENRYVELLSPVYTMCKVISYGGPMQIRKMAKECPPLAMALALHTSKTGDDPNVLEFPVVDVAATMGWESGICKHKLKNLEWITVNNQPKRSSISVQFSNLGFRLFAPGNLSDDELDTTLDSLYNRVVDQEQKALLQLHAVHKTLMEITQPSYRACTSKEGDTLIKSKVREYFNSPDPLKLVTDEEPKKFNEEQLVKDICALICMYKDNTFTGRAIARILQGIQSPNYPATIWGRCKFWRSHLDIDFHTIVKIATREIIRMR